MTDNNHPITPPQWQVDAWFKQVLAMGADVDAVFLEAARWGADQELEACCECIDGLAHGADAILADLRAARRPNPPSLKEQALDELDRIQTHDESGQEIVNLSVIRRALESLPD